MLVLMLVLYGFMVFVGGIWWFYPFFFAGENVEKWGTPRKRMWEKLGEELKRSRDALNEREIDPTISMDQCGRKHRYRSFIIIIIIINCANPHATLPEIFCVQVDCSAPTCSAQPAQALGRGKAMGKPLETLAVLLVMFSGGDY
jgi:hypothetical protein